MRVLAEQLARLIGAERPAWDHGLGLLDERDQPRQRCLVGS